MTGYPPIHQRIGRLANARSKPGRPDTPENFDPYRWLARWHFRLGVQSLWTAMYPEEAGQ
jgi:hypothetical protein